MQRLAYDVSHSIQKLSHYLQQLTPRKRNSNAACQKTRCQNPALRDGESDSRRRDKDAGTTKQDRGEDAAGRDTEVGK